MKMRIFFAAFMVMLLGSFVARADEDIISPIDDVIAPIDNIQPTNFTPDHYLSYKIM
jgi:hypothetical protein